MGDDELNARGNHEGQFQQGVGGWAEYAVQMTEAKDTARHDVTVPPGKLIPVIFLPGVMGSNLRMSRLRQTQLDRPDNRSWRPDDLMGVGGTSAVVTGNGLGGWFKNATPRERQLVFDPTETEVEYYQYTESNGRFDPGGAQTVAADARHQNVPNDFVAIPPLMGRNPASTVPIPRERKPRHYETAAQIARWRGWSEVLFAGAYGTMLKATELYLNNMIWKGTLHQTWKVKGGLAQMLMQDPATFGASSGKAITEADLLKIAPCWYPVHAIGYNFVKSNGASAVVIAERIRGLVRGYRKRGFKCDEVIIVTHSMGGLLARALIHPSYGKLLDDKDVKILGMYHNVMPTIGAAGAYKRMRFGFQEKDGTADEYAAQVLGINGEHATAILANAPAPLEMMPGKAYGKEWLKVVNLRDEVLWSWPRGGDSALESIYLKPDKAWWRLINPGWVNPGNVREASGGGLENVMARLKSASKFLQSIETTFHPNTYASYCASKQRPSYGEVVFQVIEGMGSGLPDPQDKAPPPEDWILLTDDKKGLLTVQAGLRKLKLKLMAAKAAGDETVPSDRSAKHITGTLFVHGQKEGSGYEHQNSYADPQVLASMLYSIVQIAKTAKWA